ncbi:MAG: dTDP-4-dehydrorhamnose reductase [Actinomycetota bacterium]|nr:dTDP-4-dehydrorhamnose reductase [Actinomycetota bacterium]
MGLDNPVLVTGGNGQLGRALAKRLPAASVLDRSALDIADESVVASVIERIRPKVIINAAAYTQVDAAEADESSAMAINALGVRNLARAAERIGAVLVHVSTDYVFKGDKQGSYVEDDQVEPMSVYGRTKLAGERAAVEAERFLIVRTSWVFGEGQNFIRSIVKAAATHSELTVVDDQHGIPTYAPDLARGIVGLLEGEASGTFHLSNGGPPTTWADLAASALEICGSDATIRRVSTDEYFEGKPGPIAPRPRNSVLDCSKAAARGVVLRPWIEAVRDYVSSLDQ